MDRDGWPTINALGEWSQNWRQIPKHPRPQSIRQQRRFYASNIPYGIALPCCYLIYGNFDGQFITGYRYPTGYQYDTFATVRNGTPGLPLGYAYHWVRPVEPTEKTSLGLRWMFPVYRYNTTSGVWDEFEAQQFMFHDDLFSYARQIAWIESFVPLVEIEAGGCIQANLSGWVRWVDWQDAPPTAVEWPPKYYDWWREDVPATS